MKRFHLTALTVCALAFLSACSDDGDTINTGEKKPDTTISGIVIGAESGLPMEGQKVTLTVQDDIYTTNTKSCSGCDTAGTFSFSGEIPENVDYLLEVDPTDALHANSYKVGKTELSKQLDPIYITDIVTTSITVKDVETNQPITGLIMGYQIESTDSNVGPVVKSTEATPGVYTFTSENKSASIQITAHNLVDDAGAEFEMLDGVRINDFDFGILEGPALVQVYQGETTEVYLRKFIDLSHNVVFELYDADGLPLDVGQAFKVTHVNDNNKSKTAIKVTGSVNHYGLNVDHALSYQFLVQNFDIDYDGIIDTQNVLTFTENHVVNLGDDLAIPVQVLMLDNTRTPDVEARILNTKMVAGVRVEAVIAFNMPVVGAGEKPAMISFNSLIIDDAVIASDRVLGKDNTVLNSQGQPGGITATYQTTAGNLNKLDYNAETITVPTVDANTGLMANPYERRVATKTTLAKVEFTALNTSNTVYKIILTDPTLISDFQALTYHLTVRSEIDGTIQGVNGTLTAENTATGILDNITLDNGDYRQTASAKESTGGLSGAPLIVAENTDMLLALPNTANTSNCGTSNCSVRVFSKPVNSLLNAYQVALISPTSFYGSIKITGYTEKYVDGSGNDVSVTTMAYNNAQYVYYSADELTDLQDNGSIVIDEFNLTATQGLFKYFLKDAINQSLLDRNANSLNDVFGASINQFAKGYDVATGLGFFAPITLPTPTEGGFISSVEIDFDVVISNQRYVMTKVMNIK